MIMKATVALVMMSLLIASCDLKYNDSISGNGKVKTTQISTDTIRQVIVSDKIDLTIVPSDSAKVLLKADENLHSVIFISVNNGILRISCDKNIRIARSKEVMVYGPAVCHIEASARASVMTKDSVRCNEFTLSTTSGSEAKVSGHFNTLTITSRSGSTIYLEGKTDYLNVNASSASDIFGYTFTATRADVIASSASDVRVAILKEGHLNASSAASIIYKGSPSLLDSRSSSLGEIRKARF
jgi:hypothetical protein